MPLTQRQIDIIGEALRAAAYGPFFPETEYSAIFGIEKEEVALVAEEWPVVVKATEIKSIAVNGALNNLTGYPIKEKHYEVWSDYLSVDRAELLKVFNAWRAEYR